MIPLKGVMHLFEMVAPFTLCISFQIVEHSIEVGHDRTCLLLCKTNEPSCACNAFHNSYSVVVFLMNKTWYM